MMRIKFYVVVYVLCMCTQVLYAQSNNIKKDITEVFQNGDSQALSRAMNGLYELNYESPDEPGLYIIDTLSVLDILTHIDHVSKTITYDLDADKSIAADMLYSIYSYSIGRYDAAITSSKRIVEYIENNPDYDKDLYFVVLDLLSGYYYDIQDYISSITCAKKVLQYSQINEDSLLLYQSSMHIARSEFKLGNLKSAYKYIKVAYNHPDKEYLSARLSINSTYVEILQSLASAAITKNKHKEFASYYSELLSIFKAYPDINVSTFLEDDFIVGTFSAMLKSGYNKAEIYKNIDLLAQLRHESMVQFDSYNYELNDGIAVITRFWGENALNANNPEIARLFFDYAYEWSYKVDLSDDILTNICDWYAYYYQYTENNHILALNAYIRSLDIALKNNDKSTIGEYLKYILNVYDESVSHVRYFYARPKLENGIFLLNFSDTEYILKQWAYISEKVIAQLGEKYFNNVIKSYRDIPKDRRVFPFYSAADNKLMQAHNLIKGTNYSAALKLINELINDESLTNDDIIDLIWRIDNNLYLNTGYRESDTFLQNVLTANFVKDKSEVIAWIARERERIQNWLGYKNAYAHALVEEGKIDDAMIEYDVILSQIPYLENPDSLYLETQMMRAVDLCYYAKNYNDALLVSKEVHDVAIDKTPDNHLIISNSLSVIVQSLIELENYSEALPYCEENISILKRYKVDEDNHHLLMALQQYGDINLHLKYYDSAEQAYLTCLQNHDEYNLVVLVTNLAQIYSERLINSIKLKDGKLCLEMYYKAIELFKSYPNADPGLAFYFSPLSEQLIDILSIIPEDDRIKLCDDILSLDLLVNGSKPAMGENAEIHPLEWHANVIQCIASRFRNMECWREAILYYDKAIEYVIENDQHPWGSCLMKFYTDRANAKEDAGDWTAGIKDRILAFNSSQNNTTVITNEVEDSFRALYTSIDLALATKTMYAITMLDDSFHPHLKYEECLEILDLWRKCLNEIRQNYGDDYLSSLQHYIIRTLQKSYNEQFNKPRPYIVTDKLTLSSGIDYILCNLYINENRLNDFNQSFRKLMENIEPIDKEEDIRILRFNIVKDISSTLSHAGYTEWAFNVLEGYRYDLISNNKDYELAEKIDTEIGILAYNLGDFSRLVNCTSYVDAVVVKEFINGNHTAESLPFYDINELIQQLILLSRVQIYTNTEEVLKVLYYAKELVDSNRCLRNGNYVTSEVASNLYNELAIIEDNPQRSIEYYKKSLDITDKFDYGTSLNLAFEYINVGNFAEADSLLNDVYLYSKDQYMEPRWKSSLYKGLTKCSIYSGNYDQALMYSQERLQIQSYDYLQISQSMTSAARNNYWDTHYTSTLSDASTTDLACGSNGGNSYNAALFQKSILIRQKSAIKNNIINCNDTELIKAFDKYNQEIRSHSDSARLTEEYCMYLYSLHPEFVTSFSVPRWQEIQEALNQKDLALEFTEAFDEKSNEYYYAAILLRKGYDYPVIVKLCPKNDLLLLNYNKVDGSGFSISMFEDQSALYQLIWEPLEKYLKGVKTIYYSPYEFLNNINMEAAKKKEGAKPIGFAHNMVRVSTTAELLSEQYTSFSNAVVFGDIDYDAPFNEALIAEVDAYRSTEDNYTALRGSKHEAWERLVHAAREVEGINHLLRNNDINATNFTNDQGTEEAFKSLSGNAPDILHLATHGFYYTSEEAQEHEYFRMSDKLYYDSGVRSGIILTSGNHAWRGKSVPYGVEDGILTANEISGIDLSNTDLITLSACQTALGDIASDGVYGMQRSFKVAGVKTIIMSLWQVDDEATYLMMEKFYDELTKGKDKREAFQNAQLYIKGWADKRVKELNDTFSDKIPEIQEKKKAEYGSLLYPEYYWAAFVMLD